MNVYDLSICSQLSLFQKIFLPTPICFFEDSICSISSSSDEPTEKDGKKTIDDPKPKKKPALAMKKPAALATEGKGIKKDECMKKPAAKSLSKQSPGE